MRETRFEAEQLAELKAALGEGAATAADATGSPSDLPVTNPALDASQVSLLKGILTGEGQKADAAVTDPTAAGSMIAVLKGIVKGIGQVADAAATSAASAGGVIAFLKGLVFFASVSPLASVFWPETTTPLAVGATFTGATRDLGVSTGNTARFARFNAFVNADQAGTLLIHSAAPAGAWITVASAAIVANVPLVLSVPVSDQLHRAVVVNGGVAQGAMTLKSSYTGA